MPFLKQLIEAVSQCKIFLQTCKIVSVAPEKINEATAHLELSYSLFSLFTLWSSAAGNIACNQRIRNMPYTMNFADKKILMS